MEKTTYLSRAGALQTLVVLSLFLLASGASLAAGAAVSKPPKTIQGTVLLPSGQPAAGVSVELVRSHPVNQTAVVATRTVTNARGVYALPFMPPTVARRGPLIAQTRDFLFARSPAGAAFSDIGRVGVPQVLRLCAPASVRLHILDPSGKPAVGINAAPSYFLTPDGFYLWSPALSPRWTAVTDAHGDATLAGLPQGYTLQPGVSDQRYAQLGYPDHVVIANGAEITVKLAPGGSIAGRVTYDPTGKPAAGIEINIQGVGMNMGGGTTITDQAGLYHLSQFPAGSYNVEVILFQPDNQRWTAVARTGVILSGGDRIKGIDLTLIHGGLLTGKVTEIGTGKPVDGAQVEVYGPSHPQSSPAVDVAVTDKDGIYNIREPAGEQHVYVMTSATSDTQKDVAVANSKTTQVDLQAPPAVVIKPITGIVLDAAGKPAAGAVVAAIPAGMGGGDERSAVADNQGRFTLNPSGLAAADMLYAHQGGQWTPAPVASTMGTSVTLTLKPDAACFVTGTVTDQKGNPLPGASVTLYRWAYDTGTSVETAGADLLGRYSFGPLCAGMGYSVSADAPGYADVSSQHTAQPTPGQTSQVAALVLPKADSYAAGKVVDQSGKPVPGAQIMDYDIPNMQTSSDKQGRFRLDGVPEGRTFVYATDGSGEYASARIATGTTSDIITLRNPQALVTPTSGGPQPITENFGALSGHAAPALHAVAWLNSTPMTLDGLHGKVVVLDFWGVGCGPCVADLPAVERFWEQYRDKGVVVIGVHDSGEAAADLAKFAKEHGLTYPLAVDQDDKSHMSFGQTFTDYTVEGEPCVAVIDQNGKVATLTHQLSDAVGTVGSLLAQGG